jgi:hypothetical protein
MIKEIEIHCINNDRYGFTLPYLYKIEKDANREKSIAQILQFFTTAEKKYFITFCSEQLDEYVIGLHKKREYAPVEWYKNFGNLHYDHSRLGELESLEELITKMSNMYQGYIDAGTFSKIDEKTWE